MEKGKLIKTEIRELDEVAPGWRGKTAENPETLHKPPTIAKLDSEDTFFTNLAKAKKFYTEHNNTWPRDGKGNALEYKLARWLRSQQALEEQGRLPDDFAKRLDNALLGWRMGVAGDLERQWQASLAELVAVVDKAGDLPTGKPAEWMYDQRRSLVQGTMSKAHLKALEKAVVGWHGRAKKPRQPRKPRKTV